MPVRYIVSNDKTGASDYPEALSHYDGTAPLWRVVLWPHRSLSRKGFVTFIAITCAALSLPLLALLGTLLLWGLLPFLAATVAAVWYGLKRSYRDGQIVEELSLWKDHIALVRRDPDGSDRRWAANPYWVQVCRHDAPVPDYLTLRGGDREVELGSFLSAEERVALRDELQNALHSLPSQNSSV